MIEVYRRKSRWPAFVFGVIAGFCLSSLIALKGNTNEDAVVAVLNAQADGVIYGIYTSQDEKEEILALAAAKTWKEMAKDKETVKAISKNVLRRDEPFHLAVTAEALRILNERNQQR